MHELRPRPAAERMQIVANKVRTVDIAVLMELPGDMPPALAALSDHYWLVAAPQKDAVLNTVIFARKEVFEEPSRDVFYHADERMNPRIVGATLSVKDGQDLWAPGPG